MRIIPVAALLVILFPQHATAASCSEISWGSREPLTALAAKGTTLWIGTSDSIESWDTSDPLRPDRISRTEASDVRDIALIGNEVLALTDGKLLKVTPTGEITATHAAQGREVAAAGGYAVTASHDSVTLWRVEARQIIPVATATVNGPIESIAFDGSTVVVARAGRGLAAWDVSGEAFVRPRSGGIGARDVILMDGHGWAAAGASGLVRFDPSTLTSPAGGAIDSGKGDFVTITASGNRIYTGDAAGVIHSYLISGSTATRIDSFEFPVVQFDVTEHAIFASGLPLSRFGEPMPRNERVILFDPASFDRIGSIDGATTSLTGAAVLGDLVYVLDAPLLRTFEIRNGSLFEISTTSFGDASDTIRVEGGYAIVYGRGDAHLLSLEDPRSPRYLGVFRGLGTSPNDVAMAGDLLLEVNRGSGFHILDISDPARPAQIGGMINDGFGQHHKIAATPLAAYSAADAVVKVIDLRDLAAVADPWTSRYKATLPHSGVIDLDTVPGAVPLLVIADGVNVFVYSLEHPIDPVLRGSVEVGPMEALRRIDDSRAVAVALRDGGIVTVDVSDPARPQVRSVREDIDAFDVRGNDRWLVASIGSSIVVLPRGENDVAVPALEVERAADGMLLVQWPGRDEWLVSFSQYEDMRDAETFGIGGEAAVLAAGEEWRFARATMPHCPSITAATAIEPYEDEIATLQRSVRLVGSPGSLVEARLGVRNRSGERQMLAVIEADEHLTLSATTIDVAPHASASVTVTARIPQQPTESSVTIGDETVSILLDPVIHRAASSSIPEIVVPGVGNTPGARGTHWRSNLDLVCASTSPCDMTLTWIRENDPRSFDLSLGAGEAVVLEDVATLFGANGTGAVGIGVVGDARVEAGAVTWNDNESGFYGQRIEAMQIGAAAGADRWIVPALAATDEFRSNIGLAAPLSATSATIRLRDMSGVVIATQQVDLPAGAVRSVPMAVAGSALTAEITGDDILAWGSRIDQQTGDATFVAATPALPHAEQLADGEWRYRIDMAGRTPGAGGAFWETNLLLTNPHSRSVLVRALWMPFVGPAEERTLEIAAMGTSAELESMLPADGLGSIVVTSDLPIVPWGRAWLRSGTGTFGQFVPAAEEPQSLPWPRATAPRSVLFPAASNAAFRSNLAMSMRDGIGERVVITVRALDGTLLTARSEKLGGWETLLLSSALTRWGIESEAAQVQVESRGSVRSLVSVVANATGDGITVATD